MCFHPHGYMKTTARTTVLAVLSPARHLHLSTKACHGSEDQVHEGRTSRLWLPSIVKGLVAIGWFVNALVMLVWMILINAWLILVRIGLWILPNG